MLFETVNSLQNCSDGTIDRYHFLEAFGFGNLHRAKRGEKIF